MYTPGRCNAWVPMTPRGVSMPMGYHAAGVHARYECIQVLHLVDECSPLAYTISRPRARQIPPTTSVPFALARLQPSLARNLSLAVGRHAPNTALINRDPVRPSSFTVIRCLLIDVSRHRLRSPTGPSCFCFSSRLCTDPGDPKRDPGLISS